MKSHFLLIAFIVQALYTHAQDTEIVHAGDDLGAHFTYLFPSFNDALVLLKNGTVSKAKMNFNTFLCKMQFIESTGDTLVLAKPEEVDSILLNDHSFFYNKGYYEIIGASDSFKLVALRKMKIDVLVTGALGQTTHTANVGNFDSYLTTAGPKKLEVRDDLSIQKETLYSLIGKDGVIVGASKSSFLKTFPNNKKNIENFLKSNKINFSNRADLEKLFLFCVQHKSLMYTDHP